MTQRTTVAMLALAWLVCSAMFIANSAITNRREAAQSLQASTIGLQRLVSQRAGQNDAHLTSLSALAVAGPKPPIDLMLQVAAAISRFYPPVVAVDLISMNDDAVTISSRKQAAITADLSARLRGAASASTGQIVVVTSGAPAGHFLLVKRSPNNELARFALALEIDAALLLASEDDFWQRNDVTTSLSLANGTGLIRRGAAVDLPAPSASLPVVGGWLEPIESSRSIDSTSHPLVLKARRALAITDIFPPGSLATGVAAIGVVLAGAALLLQLVLRTRAAERRARIGEQDARIAHASRVNGLGEMASGIAHELTQPLTAILSQSQAGLRMLASKQESTDPVKDVLEANVAQARRAADLLERLRAWSRLAPAEHGPHPLNRGVRNVIGLLDAELASRDIELLLSLDPRDPIVLGDGIEIEQVVFNLLRNAMDAIEIARQSKPYQGRIVISTQALAGVVALDIADNGCGISESIRERVFEPFASSKENSMGLGLALSARIVNRMQGRIELQANEPSGALARVILPAQAMTPQTGSNVRHGDAQRVQAAPPIERTV